MGSIHDFTDEGPPEVSASQSILHPNDRTSVIGHYGYDKVGGVSVATFPRTRQEHWFRGESSSGLTGYGLSQSVLDRLDNRDVERVLIIETDTARVLEFELVDFLSGTLVAYSPDTNQSVIGDDSLRIDMSLYNDRQRVVSESNARRVLDREDFTITK
jgi:hypothetical protein